MRLGLLGCDGDVIRLAAFAQQCGHQVVAAVDAQAEAEALSQTFPHIRFYAGWEEYLGGVVDVAIVASALSSDREAAMRAYVQEGLPLLVMHPACEMIFALELEMIRRDTHCVLVSCAANLGGEPATAIRQALKRPEQWGEIDQFVVARQTRDASREQAIRMLAQDLAWIVSTMGELVSVSATGPEFTSDNFSRLSVQMATRGGHAIRWDLLRGDPALQVELLAQRDRARWSLSPKLEDADFDRALRQVRQAIDDAPIQFSWNDASHALEAGDAVLTSLRRKRTIAMRDAEISEESTFKAMMATGGCLLLLAAMGVALAMVVWGVFIPDRADSWLGRNWPLGLLATLVLFLSLQLLRLVFRQPPKSNSPLEK
ncbi:MAG: hypothetical protein ACIALR_03860 [Blastopirellula sp. JB062]